MDAGGVCLLILLTAPVTAPPCTVRSDVKEDLAHTDTLQFLKQQKTLHGNSLKTEKRVFDRMPYDIFDTGSVRERY